MVIKVISKVFETWGQDTTQNFYVSICCVVVTRVLQMSDPPTPVQTSLNGIATVVDVFFVHVPRFLCPPVHQSDWSFQSVWRVSSGTTSVRYVVVLGRVERKSLDTSQMDSDLGIRRKMTEWLVCWWIRGQKGRHFTLPLLLVEHPKVILIHFVTWIPRIVW